MAGIGFSVWVRAGFRSENPDPIHNNISNQNSKTHTGRKLNNTVEKILGHVPGYVSWERGATLELSKTILNQIHSLILSKNTWPYLLTSLRILKKSFSTKIVGAMN